MSKYGKLQEIINKYVDNWMVLFWRTWYNVIMSDTYIMLIHKFLDWSWTCYSFHDLFSIESWLMEYVAMRENNNVVWIWYYDWEELDWNWDIFKDMEVEYHYMIMWPMTSEQKIDYFLENVM